MPDRDQFRRQLDEAGVYAHEGIGQNFLIDDGYLSAMASRVSQGSTVIEVGSGPGNLTELLAQRAGKVIGLEIDTQFRPLLDRVQAKYKNVEIVYTDAVRSISKYTGGFHPFSDVQIVANLPFHITEPFLTKTIGLGVSDISLLLGDKAAEEIAASPESWSFGKLSLLAQTFYDISIVTSVPRQAFYPQPPTDSSIVVFYPKNKRELNSSRSNAIFARLFQNANKNGLVINEIKQALVEQGSGYGTLDKHESHQRDRANVKRELRNMRDTGDSNNSGGDRRSNLVLSQSHALDMISRMGISDLTLRKPFNRFDNQEIRELTIAVRKYFSQYPLCDTN